MRSPLPAAIALLALVASAALASDDLPTLVERLGSDDTTLRNAAYQTLLREKDPAVIPLLAAALPGYSVSGQSYGLSILGGFRGKKVEAALRRLTTSGVPYLEAGAAAQLWIAGDRKAASTIVRVLETEGLDTSALTMVLSRLYSVRDARVEAAVLALISADRAPTVIGAVLYHVAVARGTTGGPAPPAVVALLEDDRPSVKALAAAALVRMGHVQHATTLADAIRTHAVGYSELSRVRSLLFTLTSLPRDVLAAVMEWIAVETNPSIVRTGIELLGKYGYAPAVPTLRKLLEHENETVSTAAFEALSAFPGALQPEQLRALLEAEDTGQRLRAADALRRMDDLSGLSSVLALSAAGSPARAEAVKILGSFRVGESVEPLLAALEDESVTVRTNAYNSLQQVWTSLFPYRRIVLSTTGYAATAGEAARKEGLEKIRAWWRTHKDRPW